MPSMTLATIYSTLVVLQRSGLIQELPFQRMSRYEAIMDPHVNLVCIASRPSWMPTRARRQWLASVNGS